MVWFGLVWFGLGVYMRTYAFDVSLGFVCYMYSRNVCMYMGYLIHLL